MKTLAGLQESFRKWRLIGLGYCVASLAVGALAALLHGRWQAWLAQLGPLVPGLAIAGWAHVALRRARANPRSLRARRTWYALWRKAAHGS